MPICDAVNAIDATQKAYLVAFEAALSIRCSSKSAPRRSLLTAPTISPSGVMGRLARCPGAGPGSGGSVGSGLTGSHHYPYVRSRGFFDIRAGTDDCPAAAATRTNIERLGPL
jgi:hypothetical protein